MNFRPIFNDRFDFEGKTSRRSLFLQPLHFTEIWAAAVGAVAASASIASAAIAATNQPSAPNTGQQAQQLSSVNAMLLPAQRQIQAAAALGTKVTYNQPFINKQTGKISYRQVTADFTGLGNSEVQAKLADENAKLTLGLQQKFDSQYIDQALKEQQQSNPSGVAARKQEYDLIQQQMNNHPDQPIADQLQSQVSDRLKAGKGLDQFDQATLDKAVQDAQNARGGASQSPQADFAEPLTTGAAGNARQLEGQKEAIGWLSSGSTPEDVNYRREQQDMANLSAFQSGQTPESEFAQMGGAQRGATPQVNGNPLPLAPTNVTGQVASQSLNQYGTTLNNAQQQGNGWLSGIGAVINAGNSTANAFA